MVNINIKGKAGEREAIKFLQPIVNQVYLELGVEPPQLTRNVEQSRSGGYDINGLEWMALEIKRQENLQLGSYWAQVNRAAADHQEPVVMFRQNRKQWRFLVRGWLHTGGCGHRSCRCEITKADFITWFIERLRYHANELSSVES